MFFLLSWIVNSELSCFLKTLFCFHLLLCCSKEIWISYFTCQFRDQLFLEKHFSRTLVVLFMINFLSTSSIFFLSGVCNLIRTKKIHFSSQTTRSHQRTVIFCSAYRTSVKWPLLREIFNRSYFIIYIYILDAD